MLTFRQQQPDELGDDALFPVGAECGRAAFVFGDARQSSVLVLLYFFSGNTIAFLFSARAA